LKYGMSDLVDNKEGTFVQSVPGQLHDVFDRSVSEPRRASSVRRLRDAAKMLKGFFARGSLWNGGGSFVEFWGQIFNLDNGGEIEEKARKDRALGKK
jgi:hypothetical protein